jgi:threonine dehydrogenase-like Zn-dependent dehydrogenase
VDWTPIWLKEVNLHGAYWCSTESILGKTASTYTHTLDLILSGKINTKPLVTHVFDIKDYKRALEVASSKSKHKSVKILFGF